MCYSDQLELLRYIVLNVPCIAVSFVMFGQKLVEMDLELLIAAIPVEFAVHFRRQSATFLFASSALRSYFIHIFDTVFHDHRG